MNSFLHAYSIAADTNWERKNKNERKRKNPCLRKRRKSNV